MNNHEECVKIIEEMVKLGYHLMGSTADQLAYRVGDDVDFFKGMLVNYLKWKGDR